MPYVFRILPCIFLPIILILLNPGSAHSSASHISVGVFQDQLELILTTTKASDHPHCPEVDAAVNSDNQMLLEYTLLCHMLSNPPANFSINLVPFPVEDRLIQALSQGQVDISGFGLWHRHITSYKITASQPLLRQGEFNKGLYTSETILKQLPPQPMEALKSMVAVVNKNWEDDWSALNCAGIPSKHIDRYEQMFKLIARGRADVVPLSFGSSENMEKREFGISLYPVKGIKMTFPDSTHYAISNNSDKASELVAMVDHHLGQLRESGALLKLFEHAGIVNPRTATWQPLCKEHESSEQLADALAPVKP